MSTFLIRNALEKYFITCDKLGIGPYSMDGNTKRLVRVKNPWRIFAFYLINFEVFICLVYGIIVLLVQIFVSPPPYGIILTIVLIFMVSGGAIPAFFNLASIVSINDTLYVYNMYLHFDKKMSAFFKKDLDKELTHLDLVGLVAQTVLPLAIFTATLYSCSIIVLEEHPAAPLLDLIYPPITKNIFVKIFIALVFAPHCIYVAMSATLPVLYMGLFVISFNKLTMLMKLDPFKPTKTHLSSQFGVKVFPTVTLIYSIVNEMVRIVAPGMKGSTWVAHLLSIFGTIRMYKHLGMPLYLVMPTISVVLALSEVIALKNMADSRLNSFEFIRNWSSHPKADPYTRRLIKSFRPIRIEVGHFYIFEKTTFLTFMYALVNRTLELLISVRV